MSETVRDEICTAFAVANGYAKTASGSPEYKDGLRDGVLSLSNCLSPLFNYPIVHCGDSKAVLAVDREELGQPIREARSDIMMDRGVINAMASEVLDAILAKLDLREVEEVRHLAIPEGQFEAVIPVRLDTHTGRGCRYVDFAILKPPPTSKERE